MRQVKIWDKGVLTALALADLRPKSWMPGFGAFLYSPGFKKLKMLFCLCLACCMQITEALVRTSHDILEKKMWSFYLVIHLIRFQELV